MKIFLFSFKIAINTARVGTKIRLGRVSGIRAFFGLTACQKNGISEVISNERYWEIKGVTYLFDRSSYKQILYVDYLPMFSSHSVVSK